MIAVPEHEVVEPISGFEGINRFWDSRLEANVAKILPGEFYVTRHPEYIATTLGSCVSACIWDDRSKIGGMNHFMLPMTSQLSHEVTWGSLPSQATRYGNYAMEHLINAILKQGGLRKNLRAKVFGGGKVLKQKSDVGDKNADFVVQYLNSESIPILAEDLYADYARKILFFPLSGQVMMKKIQTYHNDTIIEREKRYEVSLKGSKIEGDVELFDE